MTDLLSRPLLPPGPREEAGGSARRPRGAQGRPVAVCAALAAVGAFAVSMAGCVVLTLTGWFLADAGAHGRTTDALHVGAVLWLVSHGSRLTLAGVPLGIVPLTLTLGVAWVLLRCGRWAGRTAADVDDDRALALAATTLTGLYVVLGVVTCLVAGTGSASPGLGRTILGTLLLAGTAGTAGLVSGSGRRQSVSDRVPGWVRAMLHGAARTVATLLAFSAVLVMAMFLLRLGDAGRMLSALHLGAGDYVMYAVATLAVAPNAVLLGSAYVLGPGFAVGAGTLVSPSVVCLGPVPAFPLLAALPPAGTPPTWVLAVLAVPVVAAVVGAVVAQRAYGVTAYDSSALRGFGSGLVAAVVTTVLVALAGGPMGTGRLADIGAPLGSVLVAAVMSMSLGGLVAGLATAWWQRRGDRAAR